MSGAWEHDVAFHESDAAWDATVPVNELVARYGARYPTKWWSDDADERHGPGLADLVELFPAYGWVELGDTNRWGQEENILDAYTAYLKEQEEGV